jgi:aryl-alcohol dehydrogenase-like predicted oxidoreductase
MPGCRGSRPGGGPFGHNSSSGRRLSRGRANRSLNRLSVTQEYVLRMDYTRLGNSGLQVSRACLGAMMFADAMTGLCNEVDSRRIIDHFIDSGGNFIDTADVYSWHESEGIVGRAIASRRDQIVLATKGFYPEGTGPNRGGLGRKHLTAALDASLRSLGTDYIDLYQCHNADPDTPIGETMATLHGFVQSGKVRYIGCSNWSASLIVEAQWAAADAHTTPLISLQPQYSLVARRIEDDILPTCRRHGVGVMTYSPLGGGILTGKYRRGEAPPADSRITRGGVWKRMLEDPKKSAIADDVVALAAEIGVPSTQVAIAWVAAQAGVTSVIIGPRTFEQYEQNMAGFDVSLDDDVLARLNRLSKSAR